MLLESSKKLKRFLFYIVRYENIWVQNFVKSGVNGCHWQFVPGHEQQSTVLKTPFWTVNNLMGASKIEPLQQL